MPDQESLINDQKRQDKITLSQFTYFYTQYTEYLDRLQFAGLAVICMILWPFADHQKILIWAGFVSIGYISFIIFARRFLSAGIARGYISPTLKYIMVGLCAYGACSFTVISFYLLDLTDPSLAALSVILTISLISAPALLLNYYPAYAAWNLSHTAMSMFLYYSYGYHSFAIILVILSGIYLYFSRRSIAMVYENLDLVERLSEAKLKAENANIAKSQFLTAASHDLRQPLQSISMFMSILSKGFVNDDQRRVGKKLDESVNTLTNLFNSILDLSKLDAGIIQSNITSVNIDEIFKALEVNFAPQAEDKNIELLIKHININVFTDKLLLERILRNITSNSIRYTHHGSVTITAEETHDDQVCISVRDTGIGIAKDKIEAVFEEFKQLDNNARDRRKGLGLGLSIVKRLSTILELDFNITSHEGQGTTFNIFVPLSTIETLPIINTAWNHNKIRANGEVIYIIEDEADIREGYYELLTDWGYQAVIFESFADLSNQLSQAELPPPESIIADYRLEDDHTGSQAVELIRERHGDQIPAVIITGDTDPLRRKSFAYSDLTLLHKPVSPGKLRSYLANMMRNQASSA